jgi:DnaJ family protein A protein 2
VLVDPKKRKIYDKHGEEGLAEGGPGGPGGMDDVFSRFFGGGGRGGGDEDEEGDSGRGEDIRLKMGVELKELFNGSVRRVPMQKQFVCVGCKGSGSSKPGAGKQCPACQGQGMRMEMRQMGPFVTQQPVECRRCGGEGVTINPGDECKSCNGRRVMQRQHMLEIPIERGLASGDKVVLAGESNQVPGEEPGDIVVFIVEQTPDDFPFQRVKDDLLYKQKITLTEALIGFKFSLKHMDDRTLVISSQPGDVIKPGSKKVVLGEGMPIKGMPSERGRLIVEFEIEFPGPEFVTESVRAALEKCLPPVPEFVLPAGAVGNFAEHVAVDYVARDEDTRPEAYDSDGEGGHHHGHGGGGGGQPACAQQ